MIARDLVDRAMKRAQGAQATLARVESASVGFQNDRLKSVKSSETTSMSVKVVVDGKIGVSATSDISNVEGVVERALEVAEFGAPAFFEFPGPSEAHEVRVHDPNLIPLSKDEMIGMGEEMKNILKGFDPDVLVDASVTKAVAKVELANSSGLGQESEHTGIGISCGAKWVRGTDILETWESRDWKSRDLAPGAVAENLLQRLRWAESGAGVQTGELPVIFTPYGTNVLLLGLAVGLSGKNVLLNQSPLKGKLGDRIADELFSLTDDALVDFAPGSDRYDGEGVPHRVTPLVEKGIVKNFLYDLDTAGRANSVTTGNGPGCGPTNLVVSPGETSFEEMVRNTEEGLLVHSVIGLGQGNVPSGAFSVNVHLGYKIERGKILGRVKNVMLAGNTYLALRDVRAIGDRAEWVSGPVGSALQAPPIQIGRLSVVAK